MNVSSGWFWWRLEIDIHPDLEEAFLWKLSDIGINRAAVQFHPDAPSEKTLLAWLPSYEWQESERQNLCKQLFNLANEFPLPLGNFAWHKVKETDWSIGWKKHWQADPVGSGLLVLPAWLDAPSEYNQRLIIRIDPGNAFGTGSHPTTRLCLEALEKIPLLNSKIADLGCGSGILSLAAIGLGAKKSYAVDVDSLAVRSAYENSLLNEWSQGNITFLKGSIDELSDELDNKPVDILLCNILAPVIKELAPCFDQVITKNGIAILSGLLLEETSQLSTFLDELGWKTIETATQEKWSLLKIKRKADLQNTLYKV